MRVLHAGGIVAYPTEGVYGLGCDPLNAAAVLRLLALKRRPVDKGLIVIASDVAQLSGLTRALDPQLMAPVLASWPGPVTWLLPAAAATPRWLTGAHASLAVRVTGHPIAAALCRRFGRPVVSTSANRSGAPPARSPLDVRRQLGGGVDYVVHGALGPTPGPSEIRDPISGAVVRPRGRGTRP